MELIPKTRILKLCDTFKGEYGSVTKCVIMITQNDKTIYLTEKELNELASVMSASFIGR